MRPFTPQDAIRAVEISSRYPKVHGAPVHIGFPVIHAFILHNAFYTRMQNFINSVIFVEMITGKHRNHGYWYP